MRKNKFLLMVVLISTLMFSCSDEITENVSEAPSGDMPAVRNVAKDYFDWDKVNVLPAKNHYLGKEISLTLPWSEGGADNAAIPKDWLDPFSQSKDYKQRMYSREKGWTLVYSNMMQDGPQKYFALYNMYTGILRFFFYDLSSDSGLGSTTSFWGISANKSTGLFNFTGVIGKPIHEKIDQPSQITTPNINMSGTNIRGLGFASNKWYGLELVCAYDPDVIDSNLKFDLKGWAANITMTEGTGITTGDITGTIKTNVPNSGGFNLSLSDMFNKTTSTVNSSSQTLAKNVGADIDKKIKEEQKKGGEKFFTSLWNNVSKNASKWISSGLQAGAEKGLAAILSSGASVVGDAVGGFFNSLIGGGSKETISQVDLAIKMNTKISLTNETVLVGWGGIQNLIVPGATSNAEIAPLYNKPLGVWNLASTPSVETLVSIQEYNNGTHIKPGIAQYAKYTFGYQSTGNPRIVLNPEVQKNCIVYDSKYDLVVDGQINGSSLRDEDAYTFFGDDKYYLCVHGSYRESRIYSKNDTGEHIYSMLKPIKVPPFLLRVSFKLKNFRNGEVTYHSRYFPVKADGIRHSVVVIYTGRENNSGGNTGGGNTGGGGGIPELPGGEVPLW